MGNYYYFKAENHKHIKGIVKLVKPYLIGTNVVDNTFLVKSVHLSCDEFYITYATDPETKLLLVYKSELKQDLGTNKKVIETLYGEGNEV